MKPAILAALTLAALTAGCATSSTSGRASDQVVSAPALQPSLPAVDLAGFATYMRDNFQNATWFGAITKYEPFGNGVQIVTTLTKDQPEDMSAASAMCVAAIGQLGMDASVRVSTASMDRLVIKYPGSTCRF